ncbi:hypothetical protein I317_06108 [Kwoniella heveanensis CBS 569]|nr:hypothetical protein I317_06108 [Kwoniella heveanensis CBS 569]
MLAPPQRHRERHKRPRSPSPASEPDLASPVDVILKRRRRDELQYSSPIGSGAGATAAAGNDISPFVLSPHGPGIANHTEVDYFNLPPTGQYAGRDDQGGEGVHAESSAAALRRSMAGVERRRTKQWEKQNAPQPSTTASQPTPPPAQFLTPNARSAYSQPNPMSSSPIRNVPPSSSPFRDKGDTSWLDVTLRHDQSLMDLATGIQAQDEEMNEEEMKREWGDEYAVQNSLLHNLVSAI